MNGSFRVKRLICKSLKESVTRLEIWYCLEGELLKFNSFILLIAICAYTLELLSLVGHR